MNGQLKDRCVAVYMRFFVFFLLLATSHVSLAAVIEFNNTGGTNASNGLHFYIEDTTHMQVRRLNNTGQVYDPGSVPPSASLDNGIFLRANGRVYGPSHNVSAFTPTGGMFNTYSISATTPANPSAAGVQQTATANFGITSGPQVTVLWKYTTPLDFITAEVTLVIPASYAVSAANPVRYYHAFDTYLGGSDNGCGVKYGGGAAGPLVVGTYPPASGTTCPSSTSIPTGVSIVESFRERSGLTFSRYCASGWNTFFSGSSCSVLQSTQMSNTIVNTYQDTGIGIEYDFTAPGTYTFSYDFVVGSPVVPPYDHFEIRHDGAATLCSENVTVLACKTSGIPCAAADVVNTGTLTGSLTYSPSSPSMTITPTTFSLGSLASTVNLALQGTAPGGTYTLGASGLSTVPLNGIKCWNAATSTQSCAMVVSSTPCISSFECIETGLTYNNLTTTPSARNPLYTKLAGSNFKFDVVALLATGAQATAYTAASNVVVELFDDSTTPQPTCSAYASPVASQSISFIAADNGRKTVANNFNLPNTYSKLRCRVKDTNATAVNGCSSDNFSVRPGAVTLVTSASAAAPSATATPAIAAGANFTLGATTNASSSYAGTLALDTSKLTAQTTTQASSQQSGGVVGTLTPSSLTANATAVNATYTEAGYLYLAAGAYRDELFTAVDSAVGDCVTDTTSDNNLSDALVGGKYGCHIGNKTMVSLGRFIPDHFETALTQGCSTFTYSGQPFTSSKVSAYAVGGTGITGLTQNYAGAYSNALTLSDANAVTGGSLSSTSVAAGAFTNGAYTSTALSYSYSPMTHQPDTIKLRAVESSGDGVTSVQTLPAVSVEGIAEIRAGRVRMLNAFGSELLDLPMTMRSEYWQNATSGWQPNADDTCTSASLSFAAVATPDITANTCVWDTGVGVGNSGKGCSTAASSTKQFKESGVSGFAGDFNLWLKAPGSGNAGSVDVSATVPAWMQYNWTGSVGSPKGRATFGVYKPKSSKIIHRQERY